MPRLPSTHGLRTRALTRSIHRVSTRCDVCESNFDTPTEKRRHDCIPIPPGKVRCPFCSNIVDHTSPCMRCGVFACRR